MARQKTAITAKDIIILITTIIAIITAIVKFVSEVNRLGLWKEFFLDNFVSNSYCLLYLLCL